MEIKHLKNSAYYLAFPLLDSATPQTFKTGLSPAVTAYYKDGVDAWTSFTPGDTPTQIASTGVYEMDLSAAEMNRDRVLLKFTAAGAADTAFLFNMTSDIKAETLGNGAVNSSTMATGTIGEDQFVPGAITSSVLATNSITASQISVDAIGSSELAATAVNEIRDAILSDATPFAGANINALPAATAGQANGLLIVGANTGAVSITNSSGTALTLTSSGGNGHGLAVIGQGSGNGFSITPGATGDALKLNITGADGFAAGQITATFTGNLTGSVGSVAGNVVGSVNSVVTTVTADVASIQNNAITANAIANDAITNAKLANDAITASKVAADVHQELIELAFSYDAAGNYTGATPGSLVKEIADNAGGSGLTADAIADAVWDEDIVTAHGGTNAAGLIISQLTHRALATGWGTDITANSVLDYMADNGTAIYDRATHSLQAIGDSGGGGPTADAIADAVWDELVSEHLAPGSFGQRMYAADSGEAASITASSITLAASAIDNPAYYDNMLVVITEASTGAGQARRISSYAAGRLANISPDWDVTPTGTVRYMLLPAAVITELTAEAIADQVWEELIADHSSTSGSTAEALSNASSAGDPWSTPLPGAYAPDTAGDIIGNLLTTIPDNVWEELIADHSSEAGSTAERLSRLPNIAAGTAGGLPTSTDANGRVRIVSGTAVGELTTSSGRVGVYTINTGVIGFDQMGTDFFDQIQVEANDALIANNLDHLVGTATGIPTLPVGTFLDQTRRKAAGTYDRELHSLEALGSGGASPTADQIADQVWREQLSDHIGVAGSTALRLSRLPAVNAGAAGGLPTSTDSNGRVRVVSGTGAGELSLSSGRVTVSSMSTGVIGFDQMVQDFFDQIQVEANDALVANNLDHLVGTASGIPTLPAGTYLDQTRRTTSGTYNRDLHSNQAIRERGDAAWTTGGGGGGGGGPDAETIAAAVWSHTDRILTGANGITSDASPINCTAGVVDTVTSVTNLASLDTNSIADAVLSRSVANVDVGMAKHSLGQVILIQTNSSVLGGVLTTTRISDSNPSQSFTVSSEAGADPITGISP